MSTGYLSESIKCKQVKLNTGINLMLIILPVQPIFMFCMDFLLLFIYHVIAFHLYLTSITYISITEKQFPLKQNNDTNLDNLSEIIWLNGCRKYS